MKPTIHRFSLLLILGMLLAGCDDASTEDEPRPTQRTTGRVVRMNGGTEEKQAGRETASTRNGVAVAAPSDLPYTLSKETTYITEPLLPDGRPDYLGYLNREASRGVTRENNAAIPIIRALGPEFIPEEVRTEILKRLGLADLPAEGDYFQRFETETLKQQMAWEAGLEGPWSAEEYPQLAAWLEANARPLDLLREAAGREKYYVPLVIEDDMPLLRTKVPGLGAYRSVVRTLRISANAKRKAGKVDEAWRDCLTMYRLGVQLSNSPLLITQLIGTTCFIAADETAQDIATSGKPSRKQLETILKELPEYPFSKTLIASVSGSERFTILEIVCRIAINYEEFPVLGAVIAGKEKPVVSEQGMATVRRAFENVIYDIPLSMLNDAMDKQIQVMTAETYAAFQQGIEAQNQRVQAMKTNLASEMIDIDMDSWFRKLDDVSPEDKSRKMGQFYLSLLFPSFARTKVLTDRVSMTHDLTRLAIALAIHKKQHGSYPETLDALSPGILKAIPRDWFADGPFVYKREGDGYVLYSVGENAQDDGGKTSDDGEEFDDLVVRAEK